MLVSGFGFQKGRIPVPAEHLKIYRYRFFSSSWYTYIDPIYKSRNIKIFWLFNNFDRQMLREKKRIEIVSGRILSSLECRILIRIFMVWSGSGRSGSGFSILISEIPGPLQLRGRLPEHDGQQGILPFGSHRAEKARVTMTDDPYNSQITHLPPSWRRGINDKLSGLNISLPYFQNHYSLKQQPNQPL